MDGAPPFLGCSGLLSCGSPTPPPRNVRQISLYAAVGAAWTASLAVLYVVSLHSLTRNDYLVDFWANGYMPFPPASQSDLRWFWHAFFQFFRLPGGFVLEGLAAFAFLAGVLALRSHKQRLAFLFLPLAMTLLLSAFHKYPFDGRLVLFAVPAAVLVIAAGVDLVGQRPDMPARVLGLLLCAMLFFHPLVDAAKLVIEPPVADDMRPVLAYLGKQKKQEDPVYVYYWAQYGLRYYHARYGLEPVYITGSYSPGDWRIYLDELERLRGLDRVWVLVAHTYTQQRAAEKRLMLAYLDTIGAKVDAFEGKDAAVYLYDLAKEESNDGKT